MYFTIYQTSEACCVQCVHPISQTCMVTTLYSWCYSISKMMLPTMCAFNCIPFCKHGHRAIKKLVLFNFSKTVKRVLNVGNFKWFPMVWASKSSNIIKKLWNFTNMLVKMCTFHFAYMVINWPYLLVLLNFKKN